VPRLEAFFQFIRSERLMDLRTRALFRETGSRKAREFFYIRDFRVTSG